MNKRQRKKWLKQHNKYVNPKECWDLNYTIAEFILPRLRKFKEDTVGYPGYGDVDTFEKWQNVLGKMELAFEYMITNDNWWFKDPRYDYTEGLHMKCISSKDSVLGKITIEEEDWVAKIRENHQKEEYRRKQVMEEGLQLFAKYYKNLWW